MERESEAALLEAMRELVEIERVFAEIEAEARRCNTAHLDVKPSFILQRLAALKRGNAPRG